MEKNELEEFEVRDEVLNPAREAMRKSIAKKQRFQARKPIYIRSLISIVSIIVILIPVIILSIESTNSNDTNVWEIYTKSIKVNCDELETSSCYSLDYINKNFDEAYRNFPKGTIQQTTQYKYNDNIIMIKEEYQYNDLNITLYILGKQTRLLGFQIPYLEYQSINKICSIFTNNQETIYHLDINYFYYVQINSIDESITTSIFESIINSQA